MSSDVWPSAKANLLGGMGARITSGESENITSANEIASIAAAMDKEKDEKGTLGPAPILGNTVPLPRVGAPAQVIEITAQSVVDGYLASGHEILNPLGTEFK